MNKIIFFLFLVIIIAISISTTRFLEIYKPIQMNKTEWHEVYDLKSINKEYIAQGIEIYKDYLFFTVHKKDKGSILLIFKIKHNNSLEYLFKTDFPKEATHISDLSIYADYLYAIDYASNNLYKINIEKTLKNKKMLISDNISTYLNRSGSIIITKYQDRAIIYITQFILNNDIKVFYLDDIGEKDKKSIFKIKSKYFIQGLFKKNDRIFITSNIYGKDPIYITCEEKLLKTQRLKNKTTISLEGPGRMIEDIVFYNGYLFTSDEETNKIYSTTNKLFYNGIKN